ncbi:hypothetical protein PRIPAC_81809 [Pristionchus pacificus]|uniref:Uncharacterized protein n=1 Tax=Pristionchus pacificus TaxID=54126 RepID=A0A454XIZ3_PRIPA|nr:hypothetical protein PRIPAC_81809 [Pristionchus pacificus]|eukprot:PDM79728.1 hypothetical protein PRIPAC_32307 [Pristionchus pacificus]
MYMDTRNELAIRGRRVRHGREKNIRDSDYEYKMRFVTALFACNSRHFVCILVCKVELGDYHLDQQYEHYYIVRKADGMRACFHRWARYEGNDGAQPLVVVFFMNQKKEEQRIGCCGSPSF